MTQHEMQIQALIDLGNKATLGLWFSDEMQMPKLGNAQFIYSNQIERPIARFMAHGFKNKLIGTKEDNAAFVCRAANSRDAIKIIYAENQRLRKGIQDILKSGNQAVAMRIASSL